MGIWNKNFRKKRSDPRLIVWAWGFIEADFLRYYSIDLVEASFENKLTWRRFFVLLKSLPEESAYVRWLKVKENRQFAEWSEEAIERNINEMTRAGETR